MLKGIYGVRRESLKKRIGEIMTMIRNTLIGFGSFEHYKKQMDESLEKGADGDSYAFAIENLEGELIGEVGTFDCNRRMSHMKDWDRMQPSILFECTDIQETYERMKSNGVVFLNEPMTMK